MNDRPAPAVEAVDVHKSFDRGLVRALDGLTLTVAAGEYVALSGPSGCGKSTFLHLLAALDRPESGTLRVHGHDLTALDDANRYRREQIGLVFQLHNLLPHLSALDNVEIAMLGTRRSRHQQRDRALELLTAVDLGGLAQRRPPELSGGERQRVALARALADHPRFLLADEPTGSLDNASVQLVLDLLGQLRDREHVTILVVTHDPVVAAAADRTHPPERRPRRRRGHHRAVEGARLDITVGRIALERSPGVHALVSTGHCENQSSGRTPCRAGR